MNWPRASELLALCNLTTEAGRSGAQAPLSGASARRDPSTWPAARRDRKKRPLPLLRFEAALYQIYEDPVDAGAPRFRQRLNAPGDGRRQAHTVADTSLRRGH